jgi:hypothetical protein
MNEINLNGFECHMYVSSYGFMDFSLPIESGPKKVARFEPLPHEKLVDPSFRKLLAAFESVNTISPLQSVQV